MDEAMSPCSFKHLVDVLRLQIVTPDLHLMLNRTYFVDYYGLFRIQNQFHTKAKNVNNYL